MTKPRKSPSPLRRAVVAAVASAPLIGFAGVGAQAADWPGDKPVRIISVFPVGGSVDQVSRVLAEKLSANTGKQFIVENKGGASGSIGTGFVAKAPADGNTLAVVFDTHAVNPALIPSLPFDTLKDLAPVTLVGTGGMAIAVHPSTPFKSFSKLLASAKAKPDSISYGSIGTGSLGHLAMVQMGMDLGVKWTHIPYKGGGPLKTDMIAGHVPVGIGSVFLLNPLVKSGQLRAIGVTSLKEDPQMPGVKPVADQGAAGFEAYSWWGVFAPAGVPKATVDKIHGEIAKVLADPAVKAKLEAQGMTVLGGGPADLDKFNRGEIDRWGKVVRDNKINSGS